MEGWHTTTYPYIKNYGVFACPSNPYRDFATEEVNKNFKISYATNGTLEYFLDPRGSQAGVSIPALQRPAETAMVIESRQACNDTGDWVAWKSIGSCGAQHLQTHRGKGGMMNYAFFDGHSKAMTLVKALARVGPRAVAGTYNLWGIVEDGNESEWGWTWVMDMDQADNLCDYYK